MEHFSHNAGAKTQRSSVIMNICWYANNAEGPLALSICTLKVHCFPRESITAPWHTPIRLPAHTHAPALPGVHTNWGQHWGTVQLLFFPRKQKGTQYSKFCRKAGHIFCVFCANTVTRIDLLHLFLAIKGSSGLSKDQNLLKTLTLILV